MTDEAQAAPTEPVHINVQAKSSDEHYALAYLFAKDAAAEGFIPQQSLAIQTATFHAVMALVERERESRPRPRPWTP